MQQQYRHTALARLGFLVFLQHHLLSTRRFKRFLSWPGSQKQVIQLTIVITFVTFTPGNIPRDFIHQHTTIVSIGNICMLVDECINCADPHN